jgi:hypothetical protein
MYDTMPKDSLYVSVLQVTCPLEKQEISEYVGIHTLMFKDKERERN